MYGELPPPVLQCFRAGYREQRLDLTALSPQACAALSDAQIRLLGRTTAELLLPEGCGSALVRRWLSGCPGLQDLTASGIEGDGRPLHAQNLPDLRYFRTVPPGPQDLLLLPRTTVTLPRRLMVPARVDALAAWVDGTKPMPRLSAPQWKAVSTWVRPLVEEPASRHRAGLKLTSARRDAMIALLEAAPQELLCGSAAANYRAVLARLTQSGSPAWVGYDELRNFLQPVLAACWQAVSRHERPGVVVPRSPQEMQDLARLHLWVQGAGPEESVGMRDRVAARRQYFSWAQGQLDLRLPSRDTLLSAGGADGAAAVRPPQGPAVVQPGPPVRPPRGVAGSPAL